MNQKEASHAKRDCIHTLTHMIPCIRDVALMCIHVYVYNICTHAPADVV